MKNETRTVVVSGCTKGIGRAVCEAFAAGGFNICGFARSRSDIDEMGRSFTERFPSQQFLFLPADASKEDDIKRFATEVLRFTAAVDILVNNAGTFLPGELMEEEEGLLETLVETNLYSAYRLTRALVPGMMQRKRGTIFNMCSVASLQAYPNGGSYAISKFAMLGFSKQLRMEMRPHGIRVTAVMPGATLTESWKGTEHPDARFIQAADVAKTIVGIYGLSQSADVEEILVRPQQGDL